MSSAAPIMNADGIQQTIFTRLDSYKPSLWSWPHDSFMNEWWGYAIHQASIAAWNNEGRQTECARFLHNWATLANIRAAVQMYPLGTSPEFEEDGKDQANAQ